MDVGVASALTLSNYQMALNSYGQGVISSLANAIGTSSATSGPKNTAVLQDISNIYSSLTGDANSGPSTAESPSSPSNTSALTPPVGGTDSSLVTSGSTTFTAATLATSSATFGGLASASASILFAGTDVSGSDGLSSSAINLNASVALASYAAYQNGIPNGTIGAASAAAAKIDTTQPTTIQNAIQSAQSALLTSTLNILG
jgi:hypothetical protein